MLPTVGLLEMVVVLTVALLVLGPQQLVTVARQVGRGVQAVRRAWQDLKQQSGL
jgi:Sec-independent protein translocase protein TatA